MKAIYRIETFTLKDPSGVQIRTPEKAAEFFKDTFGETEELWAVYLNVKNNVADKMLVAKGSYNTILASPCDIFTPAIRLGARNFILAHNHPSGDVEPSSEDITFAKKLDKASEYVGLNFIDNLIFAGEKHFSFKKRGII